MQNFCKKHVRMRKIWYNNSNQLEMRDPNMLADMIAMLLEDLSCLNTPAKRYTSNIYSVR